MYVYYIHVIPERNLLRQLPPFQKVPFPGADVVD